MSENFNGQELDSGDGFMFEVVAEDYEPSAEINDNKPSSKSDVNIDELRAKAKSDSYPDTLIEKAIEQLDESVYNYSSFEKLMDKILNEMEDSKLEEEARKTRIKKAVKLELDSVKGISEPATHLYNLIWTHYKTSAVRANTLLHYAEGSPELDLDLYEKPIYQLILQIKQDWVANLIQDILVAYETKPEVTAYIENYLEQLGVQPEDYDKNKAALINYLPEHIKEEKSPDVYKQLRAVMLIRQSKDVKQNENNYEDAILQHTEHLLNYTASYQNYMEEGVPEDAAEALATDDTIGLMSDKEKSNIFKDIGNLAGKVVHLRYKVATDFDSAFKESLGPYADTYYSNLEAVKAKRELLKERRRLVNEQRAQQFNEQIDEFTNRLKERHDERREEQRLERAERREEARAERAERSANNYNKQNSNYNSYNQYNSSGYNNRYNDPRYNNYRRSSGRDFSPYIPTWLIATGAHILIGFILLLVLGKQAALWTGIGLAVASVGFVKQKHNEPKAVTTILLGYGLAIVGFLLSIM